MTRIKVCGITNTDDAEFAAACGVDAVGFVFAESPRQVTPERARSILRALDPFVVGVGVFVNTPVEEVRRVLEFTGCSVAQLHGDEGPEYVEALAPFGVVKAIRVGQGAGREWGGRRDACAPRGGGVTQAGSPGRAGLCHHRRFRAILLDTFVPGQPGGTGRRFDLAAAEEMVRGGYRVIVAGGLTPENVGEVVRRVRPYGVDVSSGVEAAPGRKDHGKVARFVAAVRAADHLVGRACPSTSLRAGLRPPLIQEIGS